MPDSACCVVRHTDAGPVMSYDERAKWDTFAAMLPYASREIVLSRYLGGWLCVALAGVLYAIGGALAAGQPFPPAERLVSLGWLFGSLATPLTE